MAVMLSLMLVDLLVAVLDLLSLHQFYLLSLLYHCGYDYLLHAVILHYIALHQQMHTGSMQQLIKRLSSLERRISLFRLYKTFINRVLEGSNDVRMFERNCNLEPVGSFL